MQRLQRCLGSDFTDEGVCATFVQGDTKMSPSTNRVAVITGASQGIGASLVQAFAARSYKVVATSRTIKQTDDPNVISVPGEVSDVKTAQRVVRSALEHFGRID